MDKLASFIEQNSLTWAKPNWIQPCSFKTPELPALQETINAQRISLDGRILWCDCLSSKGWDISSSLSDAYLTGQVRLCLSFNKRPANWNLEIHENLVISPFSLWDSFRFLECFSRGNGGAHLQIMKTNVCAARNPKKHIAVSEFKAD